MAAYTIIKLKDMSPLHMGTGKENYDFSASHLHSDTLSAALAAMKVRHDGAVGIKEFLDSLVISSAFPYIGNHYFLPRPLGKINVKVSDCDEYISRKKLKSVKFIEQDSWKALTSGEQVTISISQLKNGFLLSQNTDFNQPYKSSVYQRVTVPRIDGIDAEPFFFDWTFFEQNAGLYCLTNAVGTKLEEQVRLFELLGEYGIGTDKNVGGGKFTVETQPFVIPDITNANAQMLLSLYIPKEDEIQSAINLEESRYELCQRGGYMAGSQENDFWHLRKKSIYMIGVGSILKTTDTLEGKVVDLCPTDYIDNRMHPVYRSGKPFVVPVKL